MVCVLCPPLDNCSIFRNKLLKIKSVIHTDLRLWWTYNQLLIWHLRFYNYNLLLCIYTLSMTLCRCCMLHHKAWRATWHSHVFMLYRGMTIETLDLTRLLKWFWISYIKFILNNKPYNITIWHKTWPIFHLDDKARPY